MALMYAPASTINLSGKGVFSTATITSFGTFGSGSRVVTSMLSWSQIRNSFWKDGSWDMGQSILA